MNTVTVVCESSDKHQDWWQDDGKSGLRPNAKLLNQQAEKLARCKFIAAMPRWAPSPQIDTDANLLQQAEQVARTKFINMHFFKDKHQTSHETNGTSGPAGETFHRCGQAVQGPAQLTYPVTKPDGTLPFWGE